MKTVFIGGSRSISKLSAPIIERLRNIIAEEYNVLCGDANGADKAVQEFFRDAQYDNVKIYCSGDNCRNNLGQWPTEPILVHPTIKGRHYFMVKDKAMANVADKGFMIWDGKSVGSISNVRELLKQSKNTLVYFSPNGQFWPVSDELSLQALLNNCDEASRATFKKNGILNSSKKAHQVDTQVELSLS